VRFDNGNGSNSDLVMISAPVFFVKTPALLVEFLQIVGSGDSRVDTPKCRLPANVVPFCPM
jgi:hypothetical protein